MSGLRNLAGDTVWYGLSSILGRMITWLLVPLYTHVFVTGEFGIYTELYAFVAFLYAIYTYGMETAYFRFSKEKENESEVFNATFSALLFTSVLMSGLLILFSQSIVNWLGYPDKSIVIYYLAGIITIDALSCIPYGRLRLNNKAKTFALIKFAQIILTVLLNLFFFVLAIKVLTADWLPGLKRFISQFYDLDFKVKYVFLANLLANAITFSLLLKHFKGYTFRLNWERLQPILAYGFPLLFMSLASATNEMLSRTLLTRWLPENFYPGQTSREALGVFGACYKLSVFMLLGIQAFRYAAEPFFFSSADQKNSPKMFSKVMTGFVGFNCLVFLAVSLNLEPISIVFLTNPAYHEGLIVVPILLMGYLFSGVYYNLSVWYKLTDKTHFGAIMTGFGAIVTVALNFLFIPIYGYLGSAFVTLITFFSMAMLSFILGRKFYPVPYQLSKIFEFVGVSAVLVFIFYNIDSGSFWLNFLIRNAVALAFLMYLYWRERSQLSGIRIFGIKIP